MPQNLEIKIKVDSHKQIKSKLEKNGIKNVTLLSQKDIYYSFDKGLLKLRIQNGEYQLIKYLRNETGKDRWSDYAILSISGEGIEDYLKQLFNEETVVEKDRELYIYKNTRIHVDRVKKLGHFIELETVVKDINESEAILEFNEVVALLDLNTRNELRMSYRDLLIKNLVN